MYKNMKSTPQTRYIGKYRVWGSEAICPSLRLGCSWGIAMMLWPKSQKHQKNPKNMVFWSKMIKNRFSIGSPLGFGLKTVKKWLFEGFWSNPPVNPQDLGILVAVSILNRAVRTKRGSFSTPPRGLTLFDGVWTGFDEVLEGRPDISLYIEILGWF